MVNSELITKSTAALNAQVLEELQVQDPSEDKANAILKGEYEDDDKRRRRLTDNTKNCE